MMSKNKDGNIDFYVHMIKSTVSESKRRKEFVNGVLHAITGSKYYKESWLDEYNKLIKKEIKTYQDEVEVEKLLKKVTNG